VAMTPGYSPKDVLEKIKAGNIRAVDLRFTDPFGMWHHFTLPTTMVNEGSFTDGHGFDGSSIRGWKAIDESDMLVVPDPATAVVDPFFAEPTMTMIADVVDPITKEDYARDPRGVARRCEQYLVSTGLGDRMYVGPEPEFFIFDDVRWDTQPHSSFYAIDSDEAPWNTSSEVSTHGYRVRSKGGYLPLPPADQQQDLRGEMMRTMEDVGIEMERQHHEVASAGQAELDMKYDTLVSMADKLQWFKYIVKQCAVRAGKTVTFMPKPLFGDNGSGMHVHFSIWKGKTNLFAGGGYAGLSDTGRWAIGGLLRHAHAVIAFTNPATNSYRRLVPHFEAPIKLAYSSRNRSAAIRIPMFSSSPAAKRFEFRCPDPLATGYLAFSAIAMACIDGIQNRIDPGDPLDKNIYDLPPEEMAQVVDAPTSLESALEALRKDHEFLLRGDVFNKELLESYLKYKYDNEVLILKTRPHPQEFAWYFDG
jgi:glutamine synthetase